MCYRGLSEGKSAVIKAETGSGKTLAYLIPLLSRLLNEAEAAGRMLGRDSGLLGLVICPTRELVLQAEKEAAKCLKRSAFLVTGAIIGGQNTQKEKARIRKGLNLIFTTPGRIVYHLKNTTTLAVAALQFIVFEEADKILEMGYKKDMMELIALLGETALTQKVLVSANFDASLESLIEQIFQQPP